MQFPYYLVALYEQVTGYLADFDKTKDAQRLLLGLDFLLGGLQRLAVDENIFGQLLPHVATLQDSNDASTDGAELSTADFLAVEGELLEHIGMSSSARKVCSMRSRNTRILAARLATACLLLSKSTLSVRRSTRL